MIPAPQSPPRVRAPPKRGTVLRFSRGDELTEPDTSVLSAGHTLPNECRRAQPRRRATCLVRWGILVESDQRAVVLDDEFDAVRNPLQ